MSVVETSFGRIAGTQNGEVHSFLGIPYAAPPIGRGRFRAPQPMKPWAGVRSANAFGPAAVQLPSPFSRMLECSEDCLYLNVWTRSLRDRKPVMVFVHGGAFVFGAGSDPSYNGAPLVEYGDTVVVTINYRLSILGFGYLQELLPDLDIAANPGLLDVMAALRWVQEGIAAFGGDPKHVTVFGESAGATCIAAMLSMQSARGLFARAISQSGGMRVAPTDSATAVAREYLSLLQVEPAQPDRLWQLPADDLIRATTQLESTTHFGINRRAAKLFRTTFRFGPVADRRMLPEEPIAAIEARANPVPLLVGTNLHEWRFFSRLIAGPGAVDEVPVRAHLDRDLGGFVNRFIEVYSELPALLGRELVDVSDAIVSDLAFRLPSICVAQAQAQHSPTFMYLFDHRAPALAGGLGACHFLEVPLVFRTMHTDTAKFLLGDGADAFRISDVMSATWQTFARTGNPQITELPEWPRYTAQQRATMRLGGTCSVELDPMSRQRRVWDALPAFGDATRA